MSNPNLQGGAETAEQLEDRAEYFRKLSGKYAKDSTQSYLCPSLNEAERRHREAAAELRLQQAETKGEQPSIPAAVAKGEMSFADAMLAIDSPAVPQPPQAASPAEQGREVKEGVIYQSRNPTGGWYYTKRNGTWFTGTDPSDDSSWVVAGKDLDLNVPSGALVPVPPAPAEAKPEEQEAKEPWEKAKADLESETGGSDLDAMDFQYAFNKGRAYERSQLAQEQPAMSAEEIAASILPANDGEFGAFSVREMIVEGIRRSIAATSSPAATPKTQGTGEGQ